jgi:2-keto-4-pentenoate hydratase/2-oxohepta-3-ene-1,7-dioic acid hydratase in catechol pathway
VRIARFAKGDGVAYGVVEGETGQPQTIAELYGHPFGVDPSGVRFTGNRYPLAEVRLLAPVLPSKVMAVGKNYAEHVKEMGDAEPPGEPVLFLKPSTSVTGPGDRLPGEEHRPGGLRGGARRDHRQALPRRAAGARGRCHLRLHLRE